MCRVAASATVHSAMVVCRSAADLVSIDSTVAEKIEPPASSLASIASDHAHPSDAKAGNSSSVRSLEPAASDDEPQTTVRLGKHP